MTLGRPETRYAEAAAFFERLGSICRVIHFDKRGTGLSDRSLPPPSLDARVQDLITVMRAEGVDRAVVTGFSEGGTMAAFFAATYPERTEGLILTGSYASWVRRDDHLWASTRRHQLRNAHVGPLAWGTGQITVGRFAPSMTGEPGFRRWAARYERASLARSKIVAWARLTADIDIRHVLSSIYAPTLVMHARGDRLVPLQSGRYLAEHIVGCASRRAPNRRPLDWFGAQVPPGRDGGVPHRCAPERGPFAEARNGSLYRHCRFDCARCASRRRSVARHPRPPR